MLEKLNNKEIEATIHGQLVGRLGCHADGKTYVVPISYAYDGEYLYCRTFEGMKIKMMRKNPNVCFQVDDTRNLSNWKSVICWGEFEELTEPKDRQHAIRQLFNRIVPSISSETMHLTADWPFAVANAEEPEVEGILFRIKLTEKTGSCEITAAAFFGGS